MSLRKWILGMVLVIGLAGCGETPIPTAVPANTPAAGEPTRPPAGAPAFSFMPKQGPAGITLHAAGANFKPKSLVILRIGLPNPVGDPIGSAPVGDDGKWSTAVIIPGNLPSGEPITSSDMRIVAMDENNNVITAQPFKYIQK